jgi:hypothetical protein
MQKDANLREIRQRAVNRRAQTRLSGATIAAQGGEIPQLREDW